MRFLFFQERHQCFFQLKVVGNQGGVFFFQTVDFVGDHVVIQESLIFIAGSFFAASLGFCLAFGFGTPLLQRLNGNAGFVVCLDDTDLLRPAQRSLLLFLCVADHGTFLLKGFGILQQFHV